MNDSSNKTLHLITNAQKLIGPYIKKTPIISSNHLNEFLGGHEIFFKAENLQVTGAFKIRSVLNSVLTLKNQNKLPQTIVAYSSGNHAQAVAWAAKEFGIRARVYMPNFSSKIKKQIVADLGAELIITRTRIEAEKKSMQDGSLANNYFLHPSASEEAIYGASTMTLEALQDLPTKNIQAVFGACGGGGLISGAYLAAKSFDSNIKVYAGEPAIANDASKSFKAKKIIGFSKTPMTIADGARTLRITNKTFEYIKKLDGFFEIKEEEIAYWTAWLNHLLKTNCEPTSALGFAAAFQWLRTQKTKQTILVLLSGGNTDQQTLKKVWRKNYLENIPNIALDLLQK